MRAVVQRVKNASVCIEGNEIAQIGHGLLVLVGLAADDNQKDMAYIADKCMNLRIFDDAEGVMNLSLAEVGAELLVVSQFTLYGDVRKGRRPSYIKAAPPDVAKSIFDDCLAVFRERCPVVKTGQFQAMMDVSLTNDGPVTILLDSKKEF
ncbi:D-tyrosyl-tRNA(Tyr) deacylase [Christensenellaceae bacterium OttesenSCG-928-K19]|nr:D-tyrosyl-tRNA(Tyr) deacylase [Christensenellaceae bacterium OttesenSCG-928-K19]